MTKVVALQNIPGLKAGKTADLTPQLQQHVDAGNAAIIPGEHEAWETAPAPAPVEPITVHTTGSAADAPMDEPEVDVDAAFDDDSDVEDEHHDAHDDKDTDEH